MGSLTVTTLGDPYILHDALPCTFTTRKALALILYLAVTGQPHTRAHLVALLWPEADAAHGSTNLRQTLGRIRQALGADADAHLLTPGDLIRLDLGTAGTVDLTKVTAAIPTSTSSATRLAALRCYEGNFCEALAIDDAPDFMAWVMAQRAHWDACYDVMAEHELHICLANGQAEDAVTLGKAWVRLRPDNEVAYRLLASAQAAAGDVTGARLTLTDCAHVWANLDLALDPATVRLQAQMQALPATAPVSPLAHTIRLPFVGRQAAFAHLRKAYEQAQRGGPHLALIEGEAGVGKSRLLGAFLQWATLQEADVVLGQAYELSGRFPFQPLAELVRARLARENAPDDLLDDAWLTELSRLVPELRERYPDLPPPVDDAGAGARLVEALAQVGLALARAHPVVWVIEDLHWSDEATRAALMMLLGRWQNESAAILLVVTLRAEERATSPELQNWVAAAERVAPVVPITLAALTPADSQQATMKLLHDTAGPALCDWLFASTAGNPLYLEQVVQGLVERGMAIWHADALMMATDVDVSQLSGWLPETLRELLLRRVRYLDATTQRVVSAASVAGGRFTEEAVQAIAGTDDEALLTALEVAERRQLIRPDGRHYTFTHDKVAEAVYGDLTPARRRFFHHRALMALKEDQTSASADLFRHALAGEEWVQAAMYAREAAFAAREIGAILDAVYFGEQLIQLLMTLPSRTQVQPSYPEPVERVYSWLGMLYLALDREEQARQLYASLLKEARAQGNRSLEGNALFLSGLLESQVAGDFMLSKQHLEAAFIIFQGLGNFEIQSVIKRELADIDLQREALTQAHTTILEAVALARKSRGVLYIAECLEESSDVAMHLGHWEGASAAAEESVLLLALVAREETNAEQAPTYMFVVPLDWPALSSQFAAITVAQPTSLNNLARVWAIQCFCHFGTARIHLGEGATGRSAHDVGWRIIAERREYRFYHHYLLDRAFGWLEEGSYASALTRIQEQINTLTNSPMRPIQPTKVEPQIALVDTHHRLFQFPEAQHFLDQATAFAENAPSVSRLLAATRWVTHHALLGEWAAACKAAIHAQAVRAQTPTQLNPFDLARYYETEALLRGGERQRAQADADALGAALGTNRRYRLMWLSMQALLDADAGDHAAAVAHLREAAELAEAMELPGEQWPILGALAAQLTEQGDAASAHALAPHAVAVIDGLAARITDTALRDHFAREARLRLPHR